MNVSSQCIELFDEDRPTIVRSLTYFLEELFPEECAPSEYFRSWLRANQGSSDDMSSLNVLKFKAVSVRIVETEKKNYVVYMIMVKFEGEDPHPAVVERRYTDFLLLYNDLKKSFPHLTKSIQFPRKVLRGNFSAEVMLERCKGFESFLNTIGSNTQLRGSKLVASFLQEKELCSALKLIENQEFFVASPLVENCFWLVNKMQTDRAPSVLQNLCLLVCLFTNTEDNRALNVAALAVRRYQSVSDADLLRYYVPLLNITLDLCHKYGKDGSSIAEQLASLKRRGVALNASTPLLQLLMQDLLPNFK